MTIKREVAKKMNLMPMITNFFLMMGELMNLVECKKNLFGEDDVKRAVE